ncbi:MAG: histidine kinase [Bacteroidetes bacterium RIFOXYA12_FULL_35_11]|nr:MAG: histidine kinase [Bacteroidetes bacterium GWF2_35_48]OFY72388.1 MAG: histidine kinase [Bacteroidetes bacterium RIFOXYA12_FULL_35_11]OFY94143.1 MAG: histidine kinase [Bacteroidetes bacterium RIFOXYB2_FULL_35_7]HBX49516.1 histidine kinase [Bacteroidales bacterium]
MSRKVNISPLVSTIKERCKICYTCVRECPAKAIKIENGQAQVIETRCIGCGNCVKVCSQDAKVFYNSVDSVLALIQKGEKVAVCIAPSFPAEFIEFDDYRILVGMIKAIGFEWVHEVAFGADLVARKYREFIQSESGMHFISSDCPAIVNFVEKYYPHLVKNLVPYVSPMIATAKVIRKKYGKETPVVFIGPCIAKKEESDEINEVLTFRELRQLFTRLGINYENTSPLEFNSPVGGKGAIFPVSRGLLQTVDLEDSILEGDIIVADGRVRFADAIKEFDAGLIKSQHIELLCCEGCIMGVGMSSQNDRYSKRAAIRNYVYNKLKNADLCGWRQDVEKYYSLDLSQEFKENDQRILIATSEELEKILKEMGKYTKEDHLNCGACGYDTCFEHALAIHKGLAENEMCLPFTISKLHNSVKELAVSNEKLVSIQQALKQSEKLAHMGQLSAGIAHELNNPLGVVIMYSNILLEECPIDSQTKKDLQLIAEQAGRCKNIVGGLLNFARNNQVKYEPVDLNELINTSLHAIIIPQNIKLEKEIILSNSGAELDKEQMVQVLSNLIKNSIEAMPDGGILKIKIEQENNTVIFTISDTGTGISKENMDKIFTPFFTTKSPGKGTGLGLPTCYGIVKMHKGDINITSNCDPQCGQTGTSFKIKIPTRL